MMEVFRRRSPTGRSSWRERPEGGIYPLILEFTGLCSQRTRRTSALQVQGTHPRCEDLHQQTGTIRETFIQSIGALECQVDYAGGPPEMISKPRTVGSPKLLSKLLLVESPKIMLKPLTRGNISPIHLSFDDEEDRIRVRTVITGKEIVDTDLKRPFKEAVKTTLTQSIIEFAGPEFKMPANSKLYDGTTDSEDHFSRFSSAANSGE
ncbi:hypothetical protein Tco_0093282 [Tanacetum coccineum]